MRHSGKARKAAFKIIGVTLIALVVIWIITFTISLIGTVGALFGAPVLAVLWIVFALFTLYFFRDPEAQPPAGANLVLSPAHGKVDAIDTITEPLFMGGECQRISMFLSVVDIHVQNAPVSGKVAFFKYTEGEFLNALRSESAVHNENLLLGFGTTEPPLQKVGVRLIAGVLARRIVPFVQEGEQLVRGERISMIQFGSRTDLYLPLNAKIKVKLGDHGIGGETVFAVLEP